MLFDASELVEGVEVDPELLEEIEADEWFPEPADDADVYYERGVRWVGEEGRMLRVPVETLAAMPGNDFDPEKLLAFSELISRDEGTRPAFQAPPAEILTVTKYDIKDSVDAQKGGYLLSSYGTSRPFTTGDEDMDWYLVDPESFLEENAWDEGERAALRSYMEAALKEAEEEGMGDLGSWYVQLRNGNHRAFAAQLAGEKYVWVYVLEPGDLPPDLADSLQ